MTHYSFPKVQCATYEFLWVSLRNMKLLPVNALTPLRAPLSFLRMRHLLLGGPLVRSPGSRRPLSHSLIWVFLYILGGISWFTSPTFYLKQGLSHKHGSQDSFHPVDISSSFVMCSPHYQHVLYPLPLLLSPISRHLAGFLQTSSKNLMRAPLRNIRNHGMSSPGLLNVEALGC